MRCFFTEKKGRSSESRLATVGTALPRDEEAGNRFARVAVRPSRDLARAVSGSVGLKMNCAVGAAVDVGGSSNWGVQLPAIGWLVEIVAGVMGVVISAGGEGTVGIACSS